MANEKRLIDANKLWNALPANDGLLMYQVKRAIRDAPTVDAVEVVRCKDCANGYESSGSSTGMRCKKWGCYDTDCECRREDFCFYGERREGE